MRSPVFATERPRQFLRRRLTLYVLHRAHLHPVGHGLATVWSLQGDVLQRLQQQPIGMTLNTQTNARATTVRPILPVT
jgi:hypothetical protein